MRITPLDIRKQEFRKTMRGLDSDEVYAFLNTVAEEYETVLSDNKRLREHIVQLEDRLQEYKGMETNLRNTLLTAEKITAEAKENARREAGLIIREAEVEAERAAETIRAHTMQLRREILELKKQKDNYLTRLKTLLESHRKVLEGFEEDFSHVDEEIEKIGRKVEEDSRRQLKAPRMSREKITEQFAQEPRDKVTWGDERKREDEPRPTMPRPGSDKGKPAESSAHSPAQPTARPADVPVSPRTVSPAQASPPLAAGRGTVAPLKTEPIGAFDGDKDRPAWEQTGKAVDGKNVTGARYGEHGGDWNDDEARRIVARSIEERVHPESRAGEGKRTPDGDVSERQTQAQAAQVHAQPGHPGPVGEHDNWKQYDVRGERPDWKSYEIPNSGVSRGAAAIGPSDTDVEKALSNLAEMSMGGGIEGGMESASSAVQGDRVQGEWSPDNAARPVEKPDQKQANWAGQDVQPSQDSSPRRDDAGEDEGETWSMEELRRNLTNFGQNGD